jgi:enamine deaminase RidA (YjgF/YER057c/UK114 family)
MNHPFCMNEIETKSGLASTPGYRYAKLTGNQLHVAGQVPQDSSGNIVEVDDPYAQAVQCLVNLKTLMSCYDFTTQDIHHLTIYVLGPRSNLTTAWRAVLEDFSNDVPPATLIGVSMLGHEGQLVEIDATIIRNAV